MSLRLRRLTGLVKRKPQMIVHHGMVRRLSHRLLNEMQGLTGVTQFVMDPPKRVEKEGVRRGLFKFLRQNERPLKALLITLLIGQQRCQIVGRHKCARVLL